MSPAAGPIEQAGAGDKRQTEMLHKARNESGKVDGYRKLHDDLLGAG